MTAADLSPIVKPAPVKLRAEFRDRLREFVARVNAAWLDSWTDWTSGEVAPSVTDLIEGWQVAGQVFGWGASRPATPPEEAGFLLLGGPFHGRIVDRPEDLCGPTTPELVPAFSYTVWTGDVLEVQAERGELVGIYHETPPIRLSTSAR